MLKITRRWEQYPEAGHNHASDINFLKDFF